ncbi:hypothetical protein JCM10213_008811 [Rhodosporidiobolus nylandii]
MRFTTVALAAAIASVAAASPVTLFKRDRPNSTGAPYIGELVSPQPGESFQLGQNVSFAYIATPEGAGVPHFPSTISSVDVGLQGPAPIVQGDSWAPSGILEFFNDGYTGGPGAWVNQSLFLDSGVITEPGTYYLIVTEHQRATYIAPGPIYRVQSYNISLTLSAAESAA